MTNKAPFRSKLGPEHQAEIGRNRERFEKLEAALTSIISVVEQIADAPKGDEGMRRVAEFIELRELALLTILRTEDLSHVLRISSEQLAAILRESIYEEGGRLQIHFPMLDMMIQTLTKGRNQLVQGFDRSGEVSGSATMREIADKLSSQPPPLNALPESTIRTIDTSTNAAAYIATTRKEPKAVGRVLDQARQDLQELSGEQLIRRMVYYQIICSSLARLLGATSDTRNDLDDLFTESANGASDEEQAALFEAFDLQGREDEMIQLARQLMLRMEFILELMEQETGVDHILTQLIPTRKLYTLRKRIEEKMPSGAAKEKAFRIIDTAMERRQRLSTRKSANEIIRGKQPPKETPEINPEDTEGIEFIEEEIQFLWPENGNGEED